MFQFGDILRVKLVPGRIERQYFVVLVGEPVSGGGHRYIGLFPGDEEPPWEGKVYTEDIIEKVGTCDDVQDLREKERNG